MSDFQDLMEKDPLSLTKEDRAEIIRMFREDRAKWALGEKAPRGEAVPRGEAAPKAPKARKPRAPKVPKVPLGDIDLL